VICFLVPLAQSAGKSISTGSASSSALKMEGSGKQAKNQTVALMPMDKANSDFLGGME